MTLPTWLAALVLLALGVLLFVPRPWLRGLWRRVLEAVERSPGMLVPLAVLVLAATACGSPVLTATRISDGAAVLEEQAAPVLEARCVQPIARASDAELAKLREVCDPLVATYDSVRVAHVALQAALIAYDAAQTGDVSRIVALAAEVTRAVVELAQRIAVLTDASRSR